MPVSHFVNAILLCDALVATDSYRVRRIIARGRPVSAPVARVIASCVQKTGIVAVAGGFGSLKADGIEAPITDSFDTVDAGPLSKGWRFEHSMLAYCVPLTKLNLQRALAATTRTETTLQTS